MTKIKEYLVIISLKPFFPELAKIVHFFQVSHFLKTEVLRDHLCSCRMHEFRLTPFQTVSGVVMGIPKAKLWHSLPLFGKLWNFVFLYFSVIPVFFFFLSIVSSSEFFFYKKEGKSTAEPEEAMKRLYCDQY